MRRTEKRERERKLEKGDREERARKRVRVVKIIFIIQKITHTHGRRDE